MAPGVYLSVEQAAAARRAVELVQEAATRFGVADRAYLDTLEELEQALDTSSQYCRHCDLRPRRSTDGLCGPCSSYHRKYGQLPTAKVLRKRTIRDDNGHHGDGPRLRAC